MTTPRYDEKGKLIRPEGYRKWVFVGASYGLSYSEKKTADAPELFHHVYIQPQAFEHYRNTGTFPEKTMLAMENYSADTKVNPRFVDLEFGLNHCWQRFGFLFVDVCTSVIGRIGCHALQEPRGPGLGLCLVRRARF